MIFTVEEISLMQAMDHGNKKMAVMDLKTHYPDIVEDLDLRGLCSRTIRKLDSISDEEFAALDLDGYFEEL